MIWELVEEDVCNTAPKSGISIYRMDARHNPPGFLYAVFLVHNNEASEPYKMVLTYFGKVPEVYNILPPGRRIVTEDQNEIQKFRSAFNSLIKGVFQNPDSLDIRVRTKNGFEADVTAQNENSVASVKLHFFGTLPLVDVLMDLKNPDEFLRRWVYGA